MAPQIPTVGQVIRLAKRQTQNDSGLKPTFENMVLKSNLNSLLYIFFGYCLKENWNQRIYVYLNTSRQISRAREVKLRPVQASHSV